MKLRLIIRWKIREIFGAGRCFEKCLENFQEIYRALEDTVLYYAIVDDQIIRTTVEIKSRYQGSFILDHF